MALVDQVADEPRTLLAVHAHPDDECITTGGILARYSAEGVRTVVVSCTADEGGIKDPELTSPEGLGMLRARELEEAGRILGVSRVALLGYRDSGMVGALSNGDPRSFLRAEPEVATGRLVRIIREERPDVVVTYAENGGYGHPDHVKAHQVAVRAIRDAADPDRYASTGAAWSVGKLYYVAFPRPWVEEFVRALRGVGIDAPESAPLGIDAGLGLDEFCTPAELVTTAIDVAAYAATKRAALAAHRSQLGPDHFLMRMPSHLARQVWSREFFRRIPGPTLVRPPERETDLFSGLR